MKKIYFSALLVIVSTTLSLAQINTPWTQYNQLPYLQNAALSGVEGYSDLKVGFKKQWSTFKGAPQTYFVGFNHAFQQNGSPTASLYNSKKPDQSVHTLRHGISGYIAENSYNYVRDTRLGAAYAVHIPITSAYYLSMGLSANYNRLKADLNQFVVRDPQDPYYLSFQNGNGTLNYFTLDAGAVLYSDKLYLGYSTQRLVRTRFNSDVQGNEKSNIRHTLIAGYTLPIGSQWEIQPSVLYRHESTLKDIYNLTAKIRYNGMLWGGVSVRPGDALSFLAGFRFNNMLSIGYSYDRSIGSTSNVSQGSHEIIIGIIPFGKNPNKALFW